MPTSILAFRHHAEELRLYAAVLAATESFRLQRDEVKDYYSLTLHEEDAFIWFNLQIILNCINPVMKALLYIQGTFFIHDMLIHCTVL